MKIITRIIDSKYFITFTVYAFSVVGFVTNDTNYKCQNILELLWI